MTSRVFNATRPRKLAVHLSLMATFGAMLLAPLAASAVQPTIQSAQSAIGCCICRGTRGGEKTSIKSCVDNTTGQACLSKCRSENAGSFVFGLDQTCQQGCSGFPTK
ncbi:MAG: hypothetical protein SF182_11030 [Deltaproteobacteria bacterium]|nr:hypothetical protein [Deltaproteobacteria bacterium]